MGDAAISSLHLDHSDGEMAPPALRNRNDLQGVDPDVALNNFPFPLSGLFLGPKT